LYTPWLRGQGVYNTPLPTPEFDNETAWRLDTGSWGHHATRENIPTIGTSPETATDARGQEPRSECHVERLYISTYIADRGRCWGAARPDVASDAGLYIYR